MRKIHRLNPIGRLTFVACVLSAAGCATTPSDSSYADAASTTADALLAANVTWLSPSAGAIIRATTTLTVSPPSGTARVVFSVDGNRVGTDGNGAPWTFPLDTSTLSNGVHTLRAVARDASGMGIGRGDITVTVANSTTTTTTDAGTTTSGGTDSGTTTTTTDAGTTTSGGTDSGTTTTTTDAGTTATWWRPTPGVSWQWQLTGTIDTTVNAHMYDIDLFDASQSVIDTLHAQGRIVICYISAGTRENWRPDAGRFPASAIGNNVSGWAGENWIDTRDATVRSIMQARLDLAVSKHCDGIEPDNIDGYTNSPGFPLTATTQLDYNRFLAAQAHTRHLSVGLKNDLDQVTQLVGDFDWALNEQCFQYSECNLLQPFITANKAVFNVEYGSASRATTICPQANALNFDSLVKDLNLDAWRVSCR